MTDKIENGGPAFPCSRTERVNYGSSGSETFHYSGLSMRDWFAGQIIAGEAGHVDGTWNSDDLATYAYKVADAMLKARGK